jgi:hypothetical protein
MLLSLAELMLSDPDTGAAWFALTSVSELLGAGKDGTSVGLLTRFRELYLRFGDRVRVFSDLKSVITAEASGQKIKGAPASGFDPAIAESIDAGRLIGLLAEARDHWLTHREKVHRFHEAGLGKHAERWEREEWFRAATTEWIRTFFSPRGLDHSDDVLAKYLRELGLSVSVETLKGDHLQFPCCWTYALLRRLADLSATLPETVVAEEFPDLVDVLRPGPNDLIDAEIAACGGQCGLIVTDDLPLARKINRLFDAHLIRLQALTVRDALNSWNPPNGRRRDWSSYTPV